jgi:hypothetical protein
MTDSIRRIATETVIPWVINKWEGRSLKSEEKHVSTKETSKSFTSLESEFVLDDYEPFDDYLEMVSDSPKNYCINNIANIDLYCYSLHTHARLLLLGKSR